MRAHAERSWPEECVGALLGTGDVLHQALPLSNAAIHRRTAFLVSAGDYLAAEAHAEALGLSVRGFYHSHPDGPARPSAQDCSSATPGLWLFVISVLAGVATGAHGFWVEDGSCRLVEVARSSAAGSPDFAPS